MAPDPIGTVDVTTGDRSPVELRDPIQMWHCAMDHLVTGL
jgi:hypothetical protein